jgi:hypothetical protein
MSESQFAYGSFTLDELRSLAASPQVGTMQAMPQSFRALADRVGEVADLLSHAQADLPNWWKGPAANQAAASLGRAAAEAREFHDSAMGAATAVSRCAQVVAEQQNQMMNVPDAQEPGVSAVVQRPTTPFEALEAARQDAAYQAAHEQAVQVVNGIAAQYVETRSQLSNIGLKFGENFTPTKETAKASTTEEGPREGYSQFTATPSSGAQVDDTPLSNSYHPPTRGRSRYTPLEEFPENIGLSAPNLTLHSSPSSHEPTSSNFFKSATSDPFVERPALNGDFKFSQSSKNRKLDKANDPTHSIEEPALAIPAGKYLPTTDPKRATFENEKPGERNRESLTYKSHSTSRAKPFNQSRKTLREGELFNTTETASPDPRVGKDLSLPPPEATHQSLPEDGHFDNQPIIPPYSGPGSVHRTREDRSPRPAYLKERKSAWLPETVAAPADGVISPDWLEQH